MALDKTGTITTGQMACASVERVGAVKTAALVGAETYAEGAEDASSERARGPVAVSNRPRRRPRRSPSRRTSSAARRTLSRARRARGGGTRRRRRPREARDGRHRVQGGARLGGGGSGGACRRRGGASVRPASARALEIPRGVRDRRRPRPRDARRRFRLAELRLGDGDITAALVVASGPTSRHGTGRWIRRLVLVRVVLRKGDPRAPLRRTRCTRRRRRRRRRCAPARGAPTARRCAC